MDGWKIRHKNIKREKKICGEIYSFVADQIEGLIDIEIGNYLYEESNGKLSLHYDRWTNGGIDVYIYDNQFCEINKWDKIDFTKEDINMPLPIDDMLMIEHLHYEDILWFIMNFKEEKKEMIKRIDRYIEWKEKYNEKNKK